MFSFDYAASKILPIHYHWPTSATESLSPPVWITTYSLITCSLPKYSYPLSTAQMHKLNKMLPTSQKTVYGSSQTSSSRLHTQFLRWNHITGKPKQKSSSFKCFSKESTRLTQKHALCVLKQPSLWEWGSTFHGLILGKQPVMFQGSFLQYQTVQQC